MLQPGFEPAIPATKRLQTYALDRAGPLESAKGVRDMKYKSNTFCCPQGNTISRQLETTNPQAQETNLAFGVEKCVYMGSQIKLSSCIYTWKMYMDNNWYLFGYRPPL
jgi:hypothetical protein